MEFSDKLSREQRNEVTKDGFKDSEMYNEAANHRLISIEKVELLPSMTHYRKKSGHETNRAKMTI